MRYSILLVIGACAIWSSCERQILEPGVDSRSTRANGILADRFKCEMDPNCNLYVPDPNPYAPGIWMGPTLTGEYCWPVAIGDPDHDGVNNECEDRLADVFRPMLRLYEDDEAPGRESYYAVDGYTNSQGMAIVRVLYMLAYYMDGGSPNPRCDEYNMGLYIVTLSGDLDACDAHFGDSEWILLELKYNDASQHWELFRGILSAHWASAGESSATHTASSFGYPAKSRGYPLVWVSRDKHGNYNSRGACDDGAYFMDTCDGATVDVRVVTFGRNIGSSEVQYINQVSSQYPYQHTGTEYFWSPITFCGWDGPSISHNRINCAGQYRNVLDHFGY